MSMLHVLDMDGTLLRNTTASLEIARALDCLDDVEFLEEAFAEGSMDSHFFAAALLKLWSELTPAIVDEVFSSAPWIGGLTDVLTDIRYRGERSVVVTLSPDFFAAKLVSFGADEVVASHFPALPFTGATGFERAAILAPADKVTAVDRIRTRLGYTRFQCIAYGDSSSDIPLFSKLDHTVAVNADRRLRSLARHRYDGEDLREAYQMARSALEAQPS
jgi:phosphoserine phosphatase